MKKTQSYLAENFMTICSHHGLKLKEEIRISQITQKWLKAVVLSLEPIKICEICQLVTLNKFACYVGRKKVLLMRYILTLKAIQI